jgi:MFS family permease
MAAHFTATPGAEGLVQLGIGLPALFVALLATPLGFVADRVGRRPVMMTGLLIYAVCGMAPLFLHALPSILLSRAGVGVAEAGVLAAGTALIGDLFQGQTRKSGSPFKLDPRRSWP